MNTLLHMAKKWKIEVAIKEEELDKGGPDDKPFPTRASHLNRRGNRTVTNSLNFFAPDVKEWGQAPIQATVGLEAIDHGTQACRQTGENKTIMSEAVENPLFCRFPCKGVRCCQQAKSCGKQGLSSFPPES